MTDIQVPGDDIDRAARNMDEVVRLLDSGVNPPSLAEMLGDASDVLAAARSFDDRWQDGRTQLRDEAKDIRSALRQVLDAFEQTDRDTSSQLQSS